MPTRSEAIKKFLSAKTHPDLASMYNLHMECQVNVAQDDGERIEGDYKGRKWHGWSDGLTTWKSFRIPWKANTVPEYKDTEMRFSLEEHAEGIGMTGWNWHKLQSMWVAYDFDAIIGHSDRHLAKLTIPELKAVHDAAFNIPWVSIRRSTSGKGLHLYVKLKPTRTENHNEHAALARAILGQMAAITGFDFKSKVDICGGNMWVWHRKMQGTDGLTLLKEGVALTDIPANWRDHIHVVSGKRRKNLPQDIRDPDTFEELAGQRPRIPLDEDHKRLIEYLRNSDSMWWWDQDHHMLVTHTHYLQLAHEELDFKGIFKSDSPGSNINEQNCFAFPMRRGSWSVRRYTPGVREHESWHQDGAGWTRCFLNRTPDLSTASKTFGGVEHKSGGFVFREAETAVKAAELLGVHIEVGVPQRGRKAKLKEHKDGRLLVEVAHVPEDDGREMSGWLADGKNWTRIYNSPIQTVSEPEVGNYDDTVRHLIYSGEHQDAGWMLKSDGLWQHEPLTHVKLALKAIGHSPKECDIITGTATMKPWKIVNKPFEPEYPGDREWNHNAAQLRFPPSEDTENVNYPTWLKLLNHIGEGLNDDLKNHPWAKANGIIHGADYLKCWIASVFQAPYEPLPWLFLYGPQNSGKSILHEALDLLLVRGYMRADAAITSSSSFNEELKNAVICVIEETDLQRNKTAYARIKDLTTSRKVSMHGKGKTPYLVRNTMHWIQCANEHTACPIFPGDSRVTVIYVDSLDPLELIPKRKLIPLLEKEAPDFLAAIMSLEIPESNDRCNVPIIDTQQKMSVIRFNQTPLEAFIDEHCHSQPGHMIKISDFYTKFVDWVEPNELEYWTKRKVGKNLPPQFPKARSRKNGHFYIGNIRWKRESPDSSIKGKYIVVGDYLELIENS